MSERVRRPWEVLLGVDSWNSEFNSVDKLLRHLGRKTRSEGSRATYLKTLAQFVKFTGLSPERLVELSKAEVEEKVQIFCDSANAPRTANRRLEELKAFFKVNGFRTGNRSNLILERHYVGARQRSRLEYIPTDEEIYKMVNKAGLNLKWRAFLLTLYTTGFRNSTARALKVGDIRDELGAGIVPLLVRVYPEMKKIVPNACKNLIPYFVFMPKETTQAVEAYLDEREIRLTTLENEQILFSSDNRRIPKEERPFSPLDMTSPQKMVRKAGKVVNIREWKHITPHSLRKAFERAVRNSGLDPKDQEFFMGHILPGSQDTYYDKTKVEEMRKKYAKIVFFPSKQTSNRELRRKQVLDTVKLLGFSDDKIKRVEEALAKYTTIDDAMEEIRKLSFSSNKTRKNSNNDTKKVIDEKDLETYLTTGWDMQTVLHSGRILITKEKKPEIENRLFEVKF